LLFEFVLLELLQRDLLGYGKLRLGVILLRRLLLYLFLSLSLIDHLSIFRGVNGVVVFDAVGEDELALEP